METGRIKLGSFQLRIRVLTSVFVAHRKKAVPMSVSTSLDVGLRNLSLKTIIIAFYSGGFSLVLITYPHQ